MSMAELRFQQNSLPGSRSNANFLTLAVPVGRDLEDGTHVVCSEDQRCRASLAGETARAEPGAAAGASLGAGGDDSSPPGHSGEDLPFTALPLVHLVILGTHTLL